MHGIRIGLMSLLGRLKSGGVSGRRGMASIAGTLAVALAVTIATPGCSKNPATGRYNFDLFLSPQQEIALGQEAAPQLIQQYGGRTDSSAAATYVDSIGRRMIPHTEGDYPNLPWEFTLLDSDVVNAFALPGGQVFISRGLARILESEAELASIVGHEIGHVTARHGNEQINRSLAIQGGVAVAQAAAGLSESQLIQAATQVVLEPGAQAFGLVYSREQELEADKLGIRYMTRAGYNPIGSLRAMQALTDAIGTPQQPEFLSTHPHGDTRIEAIEQILAEEHPEALRQPDSNIFRERFRREMLQPLGLALAGDPDGGTDGEGRGLGRYGVYSWCLICAMAGVEAE